MAQTYLTTPQGGQPPTANYSHLDGWQGRPTPVRSQEMLLLYIVDYCDKRGFKDSSSTLRREAKLPDTIKLPVDSREGLLYEWWTCFWEVYQARLHPDKPVMPVAKDYANILPKFQVAGYREHGQLMHLPSQGHMPGRPYPNGTATVVVNGQPPTTVQYPSTLPPGVNSTQGVPGITPDGAGPGASLAQNPNLQHLQGGRIVTAGRGFPTSGIPAMGPMGPYPPQLPGPSQARMVPSNAPQSGNTPQSRPPLPGQHANSPQNGDGQAMGANSSPQQPAATDISDIPPSQLQEYVQQLKLPINDMSKLSEDHKVKIREMHDQKSSKPKNPRGQKRSSPGGGEEVLPKGDSPPDKKKIKRSPQDSGAPLPSTPSLPAQPINGRPPPPPNGVPAVIPQSARGGFSGTGPLTSINGIPTPMQPPLGTGAPIYNGMHPSQMAQFREIQQVQMQRNQQAPADHQQYFSNLSHAAVAGYNISTALSAAPPTASTDPGGPMNRPPPATTVGQKGAMGPPPPPSSSGAPPNVMTSTAPPTGKSTPVMSRLTPRGMSKDSSSPGGGDGVSPERPASRPIPGSTPQATQSTPTSSAATAGTASTPGNATAVSAPSPGQFATAQQGQQIIRPQTQSPSAAPITRPSTGTMNGVSNATPTQTPTSLLPRSYGSVSTINGPPAPGNTVLASPASNGITPGSTTFTGAPSAPIVNSEPHDLFNMHLGMPFDNQLMGFQDDSFAMMDFGLGGPLDDDYSMSMFMPDPSIDTINGG
ncbi:Transcriptional activator flo8 [Serendipita sp. 396]|nr:Transcriptional activator flo8 [Serendipita sp. 396]